MGQKAFPRWGGGWFEGNKTKICHLLHVKWISRSSSNPYKAREVLTTFYVRVLSRVSRAELQTRRAPLVPDTRARAARTGSATLALTQGPQPSKRREQKARGPAGASARRRVGGVSFTEKQGCRISPRGIGEGMWGSGRSAGPPVLEHEGEEGLTLLRSSSCCCSNPGTAAMATRASSRGRLAVRGKKRLGRRRLRGASQGRPRPRLRQPPCPTAAGGLRTPPPSQQPRERPAARHVLPQSGLPRPRCRPSWSRAKKLRVAYPRSGPRGNRRPQGREKDSEQRVLAQQASS